VLRHDPDSRGTAMPGQAHLARLRRWNHNPRRCAQNHHPDQPKAFPG
jgi:hypothetical protein